MTTSSTSVVSTSSRTAAATPVRNRSRTAIARSSPASAASNRSFAGSAPSVGHMRAIAEPEASVSRHPRWPQPHTHARGVDRDVPDLAGDAVSAAQQPPSSTMPAASPVPRFR